MTDTADLTLDEARRALAPAIADAAAFDGWSAEAVETAAGLLGIRWGAEVAVIHEWGQRVDWRDVLLLPARDVFAAGVFWAGLLGRTLAWRGRPLVVGPDTRILKESA